MDTLINGNEIKARIKATGLSLKDFCERVRIAPTTIHRWEAGETEPQLKVYRRIVKALDEAALASRSAAE